MKTLYVSDLDGTLLRKNEKTSAFTNQTINELTEKGMIFSYATARSLITAKMAAEGIEAKIPLIAYNGSFIMDNVTEEIIKGNYFDQAMIRETLLDLMEHDIYPIVYSYHSGKERFAYLPEKSSNAVVEFTSFRNDRRKTVVHSEEELLEGDIFYLTCIDEPDKLELFYEKYKEKFHCIYHKDIYSGEQWLEFLPKEASKSQAILQLKEILGCDKVVVFGDGVNDVDMFRIADECYAVKNAVPELKEIATGVIGSNEEDGVAKWLLEHACSQ